ncbi:hypothetical protein [Streptomyces sp. TRM64462]|uniref:hypothetical protein n=1 Tax=Streptomyces sp. TRM64462 TaxID=2741726 RepID=UPI001585E8C7|nr:hypothetical protein [Streptomyces sp. TRM64462]
MSAGRTVTGRRLAITEAWAEMNRTGLSGACVIDEHAYCTPPLDVYVKTRGRPPVGPPVVSIRCTCACHKGCPVRREVITVQTGRPPR